MQSNTSYDDTKISTQVTQNFSIGIIFDAESDGIEFFGNSKLLPFHGIKSEFNYNSVY